MLVLKKSGRGIEKGKKKKKLTAGVVYLSRVPPFMRPRKVRHLLSKYGSIGRVYLQPEGVRVGREVGSVWGWGREVGVCVRWEVGSVCG